MENKKLSIHLPLCLEADITSECWNFYRMAIVNAYPEYEVMLLNQFNHLYMDKNKEIHYGLSLYKTNIYQAYASVLTTKYKSLDEIQSKDNFIEQTLECLKNNMYVVVECDYSLVVNYLEDKRLPFYLHEILIYGAEGDCFIIPYLQNGVWREVEVSIELVAESFWHRKNIPQDDEIQYLWRREYLAPYTILYPHRCTENIPCVYDLYHDICHILERSCIENELLLTKKYYGREYPGILSVYNGVLELLHEVLDGEFDPFNGDYSFELNMKRLHEYVCLFYKHICAFQKVFEFSFPAEVENEWKTIQMYTQQAYLLAIKHQITNNPKTIYAISDVICGAFKEHHAALEKLKICIEEKLLLHLL